MQVPNATKKKLLDGSIDFADDTLRVALFNNSTAYTFDSDTHEFVNDILDGGTTAAEFGSGTGTGYSRQTLAGTATSQDNTDDEGVFDASNTTFTGLDGADIQGAIVYKQVGADDTTPGDDPVLLVLDDGETTDLPLTTNGSDVTLTWDGEGLANIA